MVALPHHVRHGADLGETAALPQAGLEECGAFHGLDVVGHLAETVVEGRDGIARHPGQEIQCGARHRLLKQHAGPVAPLFGHDLHHVADRRPAGAAARDAGVDHEIVAGACRECGFEGAPRGFGTPAAQQIVRRTSAPGGADGIQFKFDGGDKQNPHNCKFNVQNTKIMKIFVNLP